MKKIIAICLGLLLVFTGCARQDAETSPPSTSAATSAPTESAPVETTAPVVIEPTPLNAIAMPTVTEEVTEGDQVIFRYSYQNFLPIMDDQAVADAVVLDLLSRVDAAHAAADNVLTAAKTDYTGGTGWFPYSYRITYNPVRLDKAALSFFGSQVSYSGGVHPSQVAISATYDLMTGKALSLTDILTQDFSAEELLQQILTALEPQAAALYNYYPDILRDRFSTDLGTMTDWYLSQNGLCFFFSPYDLGPYASGTILAEVPYPQLVGILKDDYFPPEPDAASGAISLAAFDGEEAAHVVQFAELILDNAAPMYLLVPDGVVSDVRIDQGSGVGDGYLQGPTVFAAERLSTGDAVTLQAALGPDATLRVSYRSGEQTQRLYLTADETGGLQVVTPEE